MKQLRVSFVQSDGLIKVFVGPLIQVLVQIDISSVVVYLSIFRVESNCFFKVT